MLSPRSASFCLCSITASLLLFLGSCNKDDSSGKSKKEAGKSKASTVQGDNVKEVKDSGDTLVWAVMADSDGFLPTVGETATGGVMMDLVMPAVTQSTFENGRLAF